MSRAFVRDQDDSIEDVSDRPVSEHPNDVTETGMAEIEAALAGARAAHASALASSDRRAIAAAARDLRRVRARHARRLRADRRPVSLRPLSFCA